MIDCCQAKGESETSPRLDAQDETELLVKPLEEDKPGGDSSRTNSARAIMAMMAVAVLWAIAASLQKMVSSTHVIARFGADRCDAGTEEMLVFATHNHPELCDGRTIWPLVAALYQVPS